MSLAFNLFIIGTLLGYGIGVFEGGEVIRGLVLSGLAMFLLIVRSYRESKQEHKEAQK